MRSLRFSRQWLAVVVLTHGCATLRRLHRTCASSVKPRQPATSMSDGNLRPRATQGIMFDNAATTRRGASLAARGTDVASGSNTLASDAREKAQRGS